MMDFPFIKKFKYDVIPMKKYFQIFFIIGLLYIAIIENITISIFLKINIVHIEFGKIIVSLWKIFNGRKKKEIE